MTTHVDDLFICKVSCLTMNHGLLQATYHHIHKKNNTVFLSDTDGKVRHVWSRTPFEISDFYPITSDKIAFITNVGKIHVWTISTDSTLRLQGINRWAKLVDIFQTSNNSLVTVSNHGDVAWWRNDTTRTKKQLPLRRIKLELVLTEIAAVYLVTAGFVVIWKDAGSEWVFRLYDSAFNRCPQFYAQALTAKLIRVHELDAKHVLIQFENQIQIWNLESSKIDDIDDCLYLRHDETTIYAVQLDGQLKKITWSPFQHETIGQFHEGVYQFLHSDRFCIDLKERKYGFILYDYMENKRQVGPELPDSWFFKILDQTQLFARGEKGIAYYWPDVADLSRYFIFDNIHHDTWKDGSGVYAIQLKESRKKLTQLTCDFLTPWIPVVDLQKIVAAYV